jgi:hypothetical protein
MANSEKGTLKRRLFRRGDSFMSGTIREVDSSTEDCHHPCRQSCSQDGRDLVYRLMVLLVKLRGGVFWRAHELTQTHSGYLRAMTERFAE